MTCKNCPRYDLQCVWWDVKPYSINQPNDQRKNETFYVTLQTVASIGVWSWCHNIERTLTRNKQLSGISQTSLSAETIRRQTDAYGLPYHGNTSDKTRSRCHWQRPSQYRRRYVIMTALVLRPRFLPTATTAALYSRAVCLNDGFGAFGWFFIARGWLFFKVTGWKREMRKSSSTLQSAPFLSRNPPDWYFTAKKTASISNWLYAA